MPQEIVHLNNVMCGIASGVLGMLHLGATFRHPITNVTHSQGGGISPFIVNNISEKYKYMSAAIDHICWNASYVLVSGGLLGKGLDLIAEKIPSFEYNHLLPYMASTMVLWWINSSDRHRLCNRKQELSDYLQNAADIVAPFATFGSLYMHYYNLW